MRKRLIIAAERQQNPQQAAEDIVDGDEDGQSRADMAVFAPSPDSVRTWFAENFSIEGLKAWLSSRAQQNSPDKGNPIGPGVGGQLA